jgi:hypothetical protein
VFQEVETPRFQDNWQVEVVRLSALCTSRFYSFLLEAVSTPGPLVCTSPPEDEEVVLEAFKDKAIPLQAFTGSEGSRRLRLPDFKTIGTRRW